MGGAITRGSHTLSPPRDTVPAQQWQLLPPRPCWGLPSVRQVPGPVGAGLARARVQSQRQRDLFIRVGTAGGSSCCAGISQRGSALLALPSVAQVRCESLTSPSLPPLPASILFTSILSTPLAFLRGSDHVEAASCFSPACFSWSSKHHRCAPEPRARLQQICCHHPQREHSIALPHAQGRWHSSSLVARALVRAAGMALPAFLLQASALLHDFGRRTFHSKSQVLRPWAPRQCQQSQELAALPVPAGTASCTWRHVHGSVQSVGLGAFREDS